ncbi:MAG: efflux RND transporter periplasmic adaptor subunit [Sphingobium sp.]|nr:efflux RND transporter periplasmic adaptor subunit [Sphingobium sp.]
MNYESSLSKDALMAGDPDAETIAKRRRLILGALALVVIVIAALVAYRMFGPKNKDTGGNSAQVPVVTVAVPGQRAVTKTANAIGTLAARVDMPVGVLGEGGRVVQVLVQPGDRVGKGQALLVIERSVQTQQIASLAAQLEVSRANAKLAQNNLDRAKALVADGFVSKADIDQKTATRDAAAAQVNVAQAQLAQMRAQVGRLDIRAPEAGIVLTRNVEPGQVVTAGSGTLFRIAKGAELEMRAQMPEDVLAGIRAGTSARITPVGMTETFTGTVWQVSPVVDPTTRQGIARIAVPYNPALRPGGFANAQVDVANVSASVLPESAVHSDQKGSYVYIINKANKVERRDVETGAVTEAGLAITKGLQGTERVVLRAGGFLQPGQTVKPKLEKTGQ